MNVKLCCNAEKFKRNNMLERGTKTCTDNREKKEPKKKKPNKENFFDKSYITKVSLLKKRYTIDLTTKLDKITKSNLGFIIDDILIVIQSNITFLQLRIRNQCS